MDYLSRQLYQDNVYIYQLDYPPYLITQTTSKFDEAFAILIF